MSLSIIQTEIFLWYREIENFCHMALPGIYTIPNVQDDQKFNLNHGRLEASSCGRTGRSVTGPGADGKVPATE